MANKISKNNQQSNNNFTHQENGIIEEEEPSLDPPSLFGGDHGHTERCWRRPASATNVPSVAVSHPTLPEFAHELGPALLDRAKLPRGYVHISGAAVPFSPSFEYNPADTGMGSGGWYSGMLQRYWRRGLGFKAPISHVVREALGGGRPVRLAPGGGRLQGLPRTLVKGGSVQHKIDLMLDITPFTKAGKSYKRPPPGANLTGRPPPGASLTT